VADQREYEGRLRNRLVSGAERLGERVDLVLSSALAKAVALIGTHSSSIYTGGPFSHAVEEDLCEKRLGGRERTRKAVLSYLYLHQSIPIQLVLINRIGEVVLTYSLMSNEVLGASELARTVRATMGGGDCCRGHDGRKSYHRTK
jgi:hypothetical protein